MLRLLLISFLLSGNCFICTVSGINSITKGDFNALLEPLLIVDITFNDRVTLFKDRTGRCYRLFLTNNKPVSCSFHTGKQTNQ